MLLTAGLPLLPDLSAEAAGLSAEPDFAAELPSEVDPGLEVLDLLGPLADALSV